MIPRPMAMALALALVPHSGGASRPDAGLDEDGPLVRESPPDMTRGPAGFDYFGAPPPTTGAAIFAPGFASTEHHDDMYPVIAPDGREVVFRINGASGGETHSMLYVTRRGDDGAWSPPSPLPFITRTMNGGGFYAPDGSRFFFTSTRMPPDGDPEDVRSRLWTVARVGDGWGEPALVDTPINAFHLNGGCFMAADGTLYASFVPPEREKHAIHVLERIGGGYPAYRLLPGAVNAAGMAVVPFVDSAAGYMLFTSVGDEGLRIKLSVVADDGRWSAPVVVDELTGPEAKFVRVSPDGRFLLFVSHKELAGSNPPATWTIDEFTDPPLDGAADINWMDASFLPGRIAALKAQFAGGD